jgi:hypothetical protein
VDLSAVSYTPYSVHDDEIFSHSKCHGFDLYVFQRLSWGDRHERVSSAWSTCAKPADTLQEGSGPLTIRHLGASSSGDDELHAPCFVNSEDYLFFQSSRVGRHLARQLEKWRRRLPFCLTIAPRSQVANE